MQVLLQVLLHVHIEGIFLGESNIAQLAPIRLVAGVNATMKLQVGLRLKSVAAGIAAVVAHPRVHLEVLVQVAAQVEGLRAVLAWEGATADVSTLPVDVEATPGAVPLAAHLAHVGLGPHVGPVVVAQVQLEGALDVGGVGAHLALEEASACRPAPTVAQLQVGAQLLQVAEGVAALVAHDALVGALEQQLLLALRQQQAARVEGHAGDLLVRGDADVRGDAALGEVGVALEAAEARAFPTHC